jgi:hypothetical protein
MAFRIRSDMQKWFSEVAQTGPIKTTFDIYYFCLMAGLLSGRRSEHASTEFVNTFVDDYKPVQTLIMGLLITAELKRLGIDVTEKKRVRELISKLFAPNTPTNLTDEGQRLLNSYASGGFDFISEERETKPYAVHEFLLDYPALIERAVEVAG